MRNSLKIAFAGLGSCLTLMAGCSRFSPPVESQKAKGSYVQGCAVEMVETIPWLDSRYAKGTLQSIFYDFAAGQMRAGENIFSFRDMKDTGEDGVSGAVRRAYESVRKARQKCDPPQFAPGGVIVAAASAKTAVKAPVKAPVKTLAKAPSKAPLKPPVKIAVKKSQGQKKGRS